MSAGNFEVSRYTDDGGNIYPIRVQPETAALVIGGVTNDPNPAPVTTSMFARSRKNRNEYGVGARSISVRFTSTLPTGYAANQSLSIPILQAATWSGISPTDTGTYLGQDVEVISKSPEFIR